MVVIQRPSHSSKKKWKKKWKKGENQIKTEKKVIQGDFFLWGDLKGKIEIIYDHEKVRSQA